MSLQFFLGSAGCGKSTTLQKHITELAEMTPSAHFLFLVPEQFTMETQRELIAQSRNGGLLNIEVLSFRRLAWRVFEETGEKSEGIMSETGKTLILRSLAGRQSGNLQILSGKLKQPGTILKVKSMLSEFWQYRIHLPELSDMIGLCRERPQLRAKLEDLKVLMEAFEQEKEDKPITGEELLERLALRIPDSVLLKNSVVVLDGFTGFTPIQKEVLDALLRTCPKVIAALTLREGEPVYGPVAEHELFALTRRTIRSLTDSANEAGVFVEEPVVFSGSSPRFEPGSALAFLEKNLFREHAGREKTCQHDGIHLNVSPHPMQEAMDAAWQIRKLVDEKQIRYREIAVIAGSLPDYEDALRRSFDTLQIPYFIDRKVSLDTNPCLEFLKSAMVCVRENFSYEAVFGMLRTGFALVGPSETDLMETYVLARGIRGINAWRKEWTDEIETLDSEEVCRADELRRQFMERMEPFLNCFGFADQEKRKTSLHFYEYVQGIRMLMESFRTRTLLEKKAEAFQEEKDLARALEYQQISQVIEDILEEAQLLLGDEILSGSEFSRILEAALAEAKVGILPPGLDQVHVGDVTRTRLDQIKVLFFLGVNDGWIPSAGTDSSFLSQMEREYLQEAGVELAPDERTESYMQRFYLYLCMTKPSRQLWVSYSLSDGNGALLRPSYLIRSLRRMFPHEGGQEKESWEAPNNLSFVNWRNGSPAAVQGAEHIPEHAAIGKELAGDLYGEMPRASVSRIERFAACPYSHFLQYGLRLFERETYEVKAADLGSIFHHALELFFKAVSHPEKGDGGYRALLHDDPARDTLVKRCLEESIRDYRQGVFFASSRNAAAVSRLERILKKTVWALLVQINRGAFFPSAFETEFQTKSRSLLTGRIDRIDRFEDEKHVWLKVLDYKSGSASFDLNGLYYGLQLQLPLYMKAAMDREKQINGGKPALPGALFYYRMKDPLIDLQPGQKPDALQILKELRPDGLFCDSAEVVNALDLTGDKISLAAPMERKNDGTLGARSKAVTLPAMNLVTDYAVHMLDELEQKMLEGGIAQYPYRRKDRTACMYCSGTGACDRDRKMPGCREHYIREFADDKIWEYLKWQ